jgi:hypothetical protein
LPDLCFLRSQQVPVCRTSAVGGRSVPDLWVLVLGVVPVKPDLCLQPVEVGPGSRTSVKVIRTIRTSVELQFAFDSSQPDPCSWLVRPFLCVVRPLRSADLCAVRTTSLRLPSDLGPIWSDLCSTWSDLCPTWFVVARPGVSVFQRVRVRAPVLKSKDFQRLLFTPPLVACLGPSIGIGAG